MTNALTSIRIKYFLILSLFIAPYFIYAQQHIEWMYNYGGSKNDNMGRALITNDQGFLVAGSSSSTEGNFSQNIGDYDGWLIKLDANGIVQWQRNYGGTNFDVMGGLIETSEGKYIVSGLTASNDGCFGQTVGERQVWLAQLDENGEKEWLKTYGGPTKENLAETEPTPDGGYIIVGYKDSEEINNVPDIPHDGWIIKVDQQGELQWQRAFVGLRNDRINDVIVTHDNGFLVLANSNSSDGDFDLHVGAFDTWIFKFNKDGELVWKKHYGGNNTEVLHAGIETADKGFILTGLTNSTDGPFAEFYGNADGFAIKIDSLGELLWVKHYGGMSVDELYNVVPTRDGNFILTGVSNSRTNDLPSDNLFFTGWIVKIDPQGNVIWSEPYGGNRHDYISTVVETAEGDLIVTGTTYSRDGDLTNNLGGSDMWIFKLTKQSTAQHAVELREIPFTLYPNPLNEGNLRIQLNTAIATDWVLHLRDINGRSVYQQTLQATATNSPIILQLNGLANGIYFCNIFNEQANFTKKVVIQR